MIKCSFITHWVHCRDLQCEIISTKIKSLIKQKYFYLYFKSIYNINKSLSQLKGVELLSVTKNSNFDYFDNKYKLKVDIKLVYHPFLWRAFILILRSNNNINDYYYENILRIFNYMYGYVDNMSNEEIITNWRKRVKRNNDRIGDNIKKEYFHIDDHNKLELINTGRILLYV